MITSPHPLSPAPLTPFSLISRDSDRRFDAEIIDVSPGQTVHLCAHSLPYLSSPLPALPSLAHLSLPLTVFQYATVKYLMDNEIEENVLAKYIKMC